MANLRPDFLPDTVYHVVHHGNGDDNIFKTRHNYIRFLNEYINYISPIAITYAYCLMPNHFHVALKIRDIDTLKYAFATRIGIKKYAAETYTAAQINARISRIDAEYIHLEIAKQFSHFLNAYAKAFNREYKRRGSLFIESIYREPVLDDQYFSNMIRYIHNNPVKHGFVSKAMDWEYSSIHSYNQLRFNVLDGHEVMTWFGDAATFWAFHEQAERNDQFNLFDV